MSDAVVSLVPFEMHQAGTVALIRMIDNIAHGRNETHGASNDADSWSRHIEGALAEFAVCKYRGWYWGGVGQIGSADVANRNIEIRWTKYQAGRLIIHKQDSDAALFCLVTGQLGTYSIRGWIRGVNGKRDEWWTAPQKGRPAYFVPQNELTAWPA